MSKKPIQKVRRPALLTNMLYLKISDKMKRDLAKVPDGYMHKSEFIRAAINAALEREGRKLED